MAPLSAAPPATPAATVGGAAGVAAVPPQTLARSVRRVVALALVAGYVEVIGFLDVGGIYPGIMTGNTVQLGLTAARAQWARFGLIGIAVGAFFVGGLLASLIRRRLRRPALELLLMALLLGLASWLRLSTDARIPFELPLLAFAMAVQGETIANFGGLSLQTIVVTNNMVKFTDAIVGRYLPGNGREPGAKPVSFKEVLLPGSAWLAYSVGAGGGAIAAAGLQLPLLVPALIVGLLTVDFLIVGM